MAIFLTGFSAKGVAMSTRELEILSALIGDPTSESLLQQFMENILEFLELFKFKYSVYVELSEFSI